MNNVHSGHSKRSKVKPLRVSTQVDISHFHDEVRRLARFLRDNFPEEVRENEAAPLEQSSAVTLAIQLLLKYKTLKGKHVS